MTFLSISNKCNTVSFSQCTFNEGFAVTDTWNYGNLGPYQQLWTHTSPLSTWFKNPRRPSKDHFLFGSSEGAHKPTSNSDRDEIGSSLLVHRRRSSDLPIMGRKENYFWGGDEPARCEKKKVFPLPKEMRPKEILWQSTKMLLFRQHKKRGRKKNGHFSFPGLFPNFFVGFFWRENDRRGRGMVQTPTPTPLFLGHLLNPGEGSFFCGNSGLRRRSAWEKKLFSLFLRLLNPQFTVKKVFCSFQFSLDLLRLRLHHSAL